MSPTAPAPAAKPINARPGGAPSAPGGAGGLNVTIDPRKLLLQYWPWLIASLVGGVVLGLVTYFALLYTTPLYDGEAWFELTSPITEMAQATQSVGREGGEAEMERFTGTQTQIMVSDRLLQRAVNTPIVKNETEWIKPFIKDGQVDIKKAAQELAKIAKSIPIPKSNLVVLRVRTGVPRDSATIANAIKDTYVDELRSQNRAMANELLEALNRRYNAVVQERNEMDRKRRALYAGQGTTGTVETLDERSNSHVMQLQQLMPVLISSQYNRDIMKERLGQYEAQLASPGGQSYPEEIRAAIDVDPTILEIKIGITRSETSLKAALDQYGLNHRSVIAMQKYINAQKAQLEEETLRLLRERFAKDIELMRNQIRSLDTTIAETMESMREARMALADVNRQLQEHKTLEEDSIRLANEAQDLSMQIANRQAIVDRATSSRVMLRASAVMPEIPAFPSLIVIVPAITVLTIFATGGVIVLREALEQRVRGPADVGLVPRMRVLGLVPDIGEDPSQPPAIETAVRDRPSGVIAECVRLIRTEILKGMGRGKHKTLLVIGGMPGSGGSSIVANLAFSCAAAERRVLIIDGNLRRPRLNEMLGLSAGPGLSEALAGTVRPEEAFRGTDTPGLDVMTAGAPDAKSYERLTTDLMSRILEEAKSRYDVVLVDVAPTIVSSDAMMLANRCDATVLVVRAYSEKRGLLARVRNQLEEARAEFLGVVVNGVRSSAGGYFRRNFRATHEYHNATLDRVNGKAVRRRGAAASAADAIERSPKRNGDITDLHHAGGAGVIETEATTEPDADDKA